MIIWRFFALVLLLLIPCFGIWSLLNPVLVEPVIGLANLILSNWLNETVVALQVDGPVAVLITHFDSLNGELVPAAETGEYLAIQQDTRILSYSIPFYAALHLATARLDRLVDLAWGIMILCFLLLTGIVCVALKDLMVTLGPQFLERPAFMQPPPQVIALLYQLNILIVPPFAPIAIWAWQSRDASLFSELSEGSD